MKARHNLRWRVEWARCSADERIVIGECVACRKRCQETVKLHDLEEMERLGLRERPWVNRIKQAFKFAACTEGR